MLSTVLLTLQLLNVYSGKYILFDESTTWYTARDQCNTLCGTHLASIHNLTDDNEAKSLCSPYQGNYGCWLGGTDEAIEGVWVWDDATSFDYSNWGVAGPDNANGDQHCLRLMNGWDDNKCSGVGDAFLCNKPPSPPATCITPAPTRLPTKTPTQRPSVPPTTTNPTLYPTISPTQNPSVSTLNPSTSVPTQLPTTITNNPTRSPSSESYGVIVTVSTDGDTDNIDLKITNITNNLVSDTIGSECNKGVTTNEKGENELEITIRVCDKTSQNTILTAIEDNNLLIEKINENGLDIEVTEVSTIGNNEGEVITATDAVTETDKDEVSEKDRMNVTLIASVVSVLVLIFVIIISCGIAYKMKKGKNIKSKAVISGPISVTGVNTETYGTYTHNAYVTSFSPSVEVQPMVGGDNDMIIIGDNETQGNNEMDDFVVETKGNSEESDNCNDDSIIVGDVNETHGNIRKDTKEVRDLSTDSISGSDELVVNDINDIKTLQ